jgi:hypothetical protein
LPTSPLRLADQRLRGGQKRADKGGRTHNTTTATHPHTSKHTQADLNTQQDRPVRSLTSALPPPSDLSLESPPAQPQPPSLPLPLLLPPLPPPSPSLPSVPCLTKSKSIWTMPRTSHSRPDWR